MNAAQIQAGMGSCLTRQRALDSFNRRRLTPRVGGSDWQEDLEREHAMRMLEGRFIQSERAKVAGLARSAPAQPEAFVRWFETLAHWGPGQGDRLFPWLARDASLAQMKWFLRQEMAGEAGFDDLVALAQIKLPLGPKLELARNYWDEMGQGHVGGMHGPLLQELVSALSIAVDDEPVWEALALGNAMVGLACDRRYAYHAIGALGVIELTAPGRAALVNAGLKRLGVAGAARRYFALHATLDVKHSLTWNREVIAPLVADHPEAAQGLAEGALMRLNAGALCFERYRSELGVR
jgi:hypothetical protein